MNLISLIARRPKQVDELEEMIQAIKTIAASGGSDDDNILRISIETIKLLLVK